MKDKNKDVANVKAATDESAKQINLMHEASKCADALKKGDIILYPTDTVWGIGCDATNSNAVKRIFNLKKRADSKAMIVLVDSIAMLERYVEEVPEVACQLIEAAVNPITIVYDHGRGLAPELLAEDGSAGIRVTTDPFCRALCRKLRRPIVSTSANISGMPSAKFYHEIAIDITKGVDYVAQWRLDDITSRQPSSVIKLSVNGEVTILRP